MNNFLIECCANSVQSAINGQIAGANRIELCNNLEAGGITPNKKEIINIKTWYENEYENTPRIVSNFFKKIF